MIESSKFNQVVVLVVGDIMLDRYCTGQTTRISPEAPVPVVKVSSMTEQAGGAGNVALNIAALGAKAKILSAVGDDSAAITLGNELAAVGVETHFISCKQCPTTVKQRILSQHQQLLRLDFEETFDIAANVVVEKFEALLEGVDVIILSDYAKGVLKNCSAKLIDIARKRNIPVLVDPKCTDFSVYKGATLITPNFSEFQKAVGVCGTETQVLEQATKLLKKSQFDSLLITRGGQGMTLFLPDESEVYLAASGREVYDVTGAGDTVISVIAVAMAAGLSTLESTKLGNMAAGIVIGKLGAATVSVDELNHELAGDHHQPSGVVSEEVMLRAIKTARAQGQRIVFTNGCFDVLHAMHVEYLTMAAELGDKLIVAVNDDASISRLKGPDRPVNALAQRMAVLAGLQSVDWVISFNDDTPYRLLELIQPDVLAKGGDYTVDQVVGREVVEAYGGEAVVLGGLKKGVKSTAIIERMRKLIDHD